MDDKSNYDNHQGLAKLRFTWLEEQVIDIHNNVSLLMLTLSNKLGLFKENGAYVERLALVGLGVIFLFLDNYL